MGPSRATHWGRHSPENYSPESTSHRIPAHLIPNLHLSSPRPPFTLESVSPASRTLLALITACLV